MPTRRLLLVELVEVTPAPEDAQYTETKHVLRVQPKWPLSMLSMTDRGVAIVVLQQFCQSLMVAGAQWIEPMVAEYDTEQAIERIEEEGMEPKSAWQREQDLKALVRAARAGLEPQGGKT